MKEIKSMTHVWDPKLVERVAKQIKKDDEDKHLWIWTSLILDGIPLYDDGVNAGLVCVRAVVMNTREQVYNMHPHEACVDKRYLTLDPETWVNPEQKKKALSSKCFTEGIS